MVVANKTPDIVECIPDPWVKYHSSKPRKRNGVNFFKPILLRITKAIKAAEVKARRELLLKQRDEKRKAYQKRRDSLLELRKKKNNPKKS